MCMQPELFFRPWLGILLQLQLQQDKTLGSLYQNNVVQTLSIFVILTQLAPYSKNGGGDGQHKKSRFILHVDVDQRNSKLVRLIKLRPLSVLAVVWPPQNSCANWCQTHMVSTNTWLVDVTSAVITCAKKNYFSLRRHPSEIILIQRVETCPKLGLFHRLIAAHEYYPTCSLLLK